MLSLGLSLSDIDRLNDLSIFEYNDLLKQLRENKSKKEKFESAKLLSAVNDIVIGFYYASAALNGGRKNSRLFRKWQKEIQRRCDKLIGTKKETIWENISRKSRRL